MDFLNDLKERAADLAQAGAELAQAGVAKSRQLAEIGRLYYAERGMAPDAAYQALCEKITASKVTIEENKARINELKEAGGVTDEEISAVETDVPPEEPSDCGCGCCGTESPFADEPKDGE